MSDASSPPPDVGVLIPAGGRGERAGPGGPKQFRTIAGVPMLLRAVRPFAQHPRVHQLVVALPPESLDAPPAWLTDLLGERLSIVAGGATRHDSVANALDALDPACTIVLVHDAARPFVTAEEIDPVIAAAAAGIGAIVAVPVSDTIKRSDDGFSIAETVPRHGLWRAQTPQAFPRDLLEDAYRQIGDRDFTDDASFIEAVGGRVTLVPGPSTNIKVTTAEDFVMAEALAAR